MKTYKNGSHETMAQKIARLELRLTQILKDISSRQPPITDVTKIPRSLNMTTFVSSVLSRPTGEVKSQAPDEGMTRFVKTNVIGPRSGE